MAINTQNNLRLLYTAFTHVCRTAFTSLANIPQRIREAGENLYNRMFPSTPVQSSPSLTERPNIQLVVNSKKPSIASAKPHKIDWMAQPTIYGENNSSKKFVYLRPDRIPLVHGSFETRRHFEIINVGR